MSEWVYDTVHPLRVFTAFMKDNKKTGKRPGRT